MPVSKIVPGCVRRRWLLVGIVQGVGFRPHVARIAQRFPLISGFCGNDALQVFIEAQGDPADLDGFINGVLEELPPLATVLRVTVSDLAVIDSEAGFRIVASEGGAGSRTLIPPDVTVCPDCLADVKDPSNRRYGYAFTTCTNCGPRLSIIEDLPYDRPNTTMRDFPLCANCEREYQDSKDRRFHAQPISCYDCGPHLWLVESGEVPDSAADPFSATRIPAELVDASRSGRSKTAQDKVLDQAAAWLREGRVLAVKGLGGFHLMVNALDETAVARLRERKHRDGKPLALMVGSLADACRLVELGEIGRQLITDAAHPIVLAPRLSGVFEGAGSENVWTVAPSVAPNLDTLGVMIAYTPLHQLLLDRLDFPVVATSGNLSSEPLCYENAEALARLSGIADAFLMHDRSIAVPVEDSVVMLGRAAGQSQVQVVPVRRSRGYVPVPFMLPVRRDETDCGSSDLVGLNDSEVILGVGGELKNTFTLVRNGMAFTSAHIGDMYSLASQQAFDAAVAQLTKIHDRQPGIVVCDLHPNYATTAWANRYVLKRRESGDDVKLLQIQHHLAHAYSLLAQSEVQRAVVISVDGTGFGDDSKIWGSEVLLVDTRDAAANSRLAHLPYFDLPGGDLAVRQPWRQALALLYGLGISAQGLPLEQWFNSVEGRVVYSQVEAGVNASSCALGRYFDAVAALLNLCPVSTYEAEAAVAVQTAAERWLCDHPGAGCGLADDFGLGSVVAGGVITVDVVRELFEQLVQGMREGLAVGQLAWLFHVGVSRLLAGAAVCGAQQMNCATVGLSGGSAMNVLLADLIGRHVKDSGLSWLMHKTVPANDGGLSLGQAYYAYLFSRIPGFV